MADLVPAPISNPLAGTSYETQTRLLMANRIGVGAPLFLFIVAILSMMEWWFRPERLNAVVAAYGAYLAVSAVQVWIVGRHPLLSIRVTVVVVNWLILVLCVYGGAVAASTQVIVMSVVLVLVSVAALYPWGARGQLCASITTVVGYPLALGLGASPSLPLPYDILGLATAVAVGVLGASLLDRQRFATYEQVVQRQEQERISSGLLRTGQALNDVLSNPQLLVHALVEQTRAAVGSDWAFVCQRDAEASAFRVSGMSRVPAMVAEEIGALILSPEAAPLLYSRLQREGTLELSDHEDELPILVGVMRRWDLTAMLLQTICRGDQVVGVLGCCFDRAHPPLTIWERRMIAGIGNQASVALENARLMEETRRADRVKSEFVATMSHELRTPLSVVIGYTGLLREENFDPTIGEQRDMIERIYEHSSELLVLIDGLLDLNRLELGRTPLSITRIASGELLETLRRHIPALWIKDGVALGWRVIDEVILYSDRAKIETILRNLIHNALKHTDSGGVEVTVRRAPESEWVELSVADSGPGIPPADQAVIFEMFRQGSSTRGGGVGLGLYIVKRLADLLGGDVRLQPSAAGGAEFILTLPLRSSAD